MIAWMMYVILVTLALSAAALAAEQASKSRRNATRWIWLVALTGSLALPTAVASVSIRVPGVLGSAASPAPIALRDATSIPMPQALVDFGGAQNYGASARIKTLVRETWLAASALMLLALAWSSVLLHRRKRGWSGHRMNGERVLVSIDTGPAVVGLLRPRIVVPAWLLQAPPEQRQHVIAHERSHLDARDPQLVALALLLLMLMPWNPLLWWQFHRLRRAIEVDCDVRVLRHGRDIGAYCETLIEVGQHRSHRIDVMPAMSGPFLETRIRLMLGKPRKWASATALAGVSLGMAVFAAQVTPPDVGHRTDDPTALSASALARNIGFYRISAISLATVTREGDGLAVRISGQIAAPKPFHIVPRSPTRFTVRGMDASVVFIQEAQGPARRLVAYRHGRKVLDASRVDRATADRIDAALAARIKAQKPFAGSEKALQLLLRDPDSGAGMSADLARLRTETRAAREAYLAELGPVESYAFTGVSEFGSDSYLVKRRHGTENVLLVLDEEGTLVSAFRHR